MALTDSASRRPHVLFLSRNPLVQETSGSTTLVLTLLQQLLQHGSEVTVLVTLAQSRSPRLMFRSRVALPHGVRFRVPGYVRLGPFYLRLFSLKAWARDLSRVAETVPVVSLLSAPLQRLFGGNLFILPWDLTESTAGETALALEEVQREQASLIIANYAFFAPTLQGLRARYGDRVLCAVMTHDLLHARVERMLAAGETLDCPPIQEAEELRWFRETQVILAAQRREFEYFRTHTQARVLLQPIELELRAPNPHPDAHRCLFVGGNILPNRSAVEFFLSEVWPLVRQAVPDAVFAIAGTVCNAAVAHLDQPGVERLGRVETLAPQYQRAAVCVVPLLVGTGIKIKLLEALSFAKAIVSTSVGIEGLPEEIRQCVLIADDAERFAEAIIHLFRSEDERRGLEQHAASFTQEQFGPGSESLRAFSSLLSEAAQL